MSSLRQGLSFFDPCSVPNVKVMQINNTNVHQDTVLLYSADLAGESGGVVNHCRSLCVAS